MVNKLNAITATAFACTFVFAAAPAAANAMFKFDRGIGSQPLRAGPAVVPAVPNPLPVANLVAGVAPGGAPWPIESLKAEIGHDGRIRATVRGLVLGGTESIGSRGGRRQMVISLFCRNPPALGTVAGTLQTVPYNSEWVELNPDGDFSLSSAMTNENGASPQANCGDVTDNRPVLLIRTVTPANITTGAPAIPGAWLAAGILKNAFRNTGDRRHSN